MNTVCLIGRLARDIELRYTQSGKAFASISVAVDKGGKDKGADFIPCVAWEGTAELIGKYFVKGDKIGIDGRLQTRKYTDKSGVDRYATEVVASRIDFCGKKGDAKQTQADYVADEDIPF